MDNTVDKKKVKNLIHSLGLKYNMSDDAINALVDSPFLFTYLKIRELDLANTTVEELAELKTNFLYKSFGKIYLSEPLFARNKKQKEAFKNLNDRKWKKKH